MSTKFPEPISVLKTFPVPCVIRLENRSSEIEREAASLIAKQPHFLGQGQPIRCLIWNGNLRMTGTVKSYFQKQIAQEAVRGMEGIDKIDNKIVVESRVANARPSHRPSGAR